MRILIKLNLHGRIIEMRDIVAGEDYVDGIIIDEQILPNIIGVEGKRSILFYKEETFYYEYVDEHLSEEEIDRMLQNGEIIIKDAISLEELKNYKKIEIGKDCENAIYKGVSVELSTGVEHFSLTEKDQINLFGKQMQLSVGAQQIEYHQDGKPCIYYTATDMNKIIEVAMFHISYHTTYCNSLNMWISGCGTREEIEKIFYGADVPEKYVSEVLGDYLIKIRQEVKMIDLENIKIKTS